MLPIKYTPYDGVRVGDIDSGIIDANDISQVLPMSRGGGSHITLKNGRSFETATEPESLLRKINQAKKEKIEAARQALMLRGQMYEATRQRAGGNKDFATADLCSVRLDEIAAALLLLE